MAGRRGQGRGRRAAAGPRRSDRRIRLMLTCISLTIVALARAHGAGAAAGRRVAREGGRGPAARRRAPLGPARSDPRPHRPGARDLLPGGHGRRLACARARSHRVRAGALEVRQDHAGRDREAHGGQRAVRVRRPPHPAVHLDGDQARPDARPARDLARDRAADRAAALLPAGRPGRPGRGRRRRRHLGRRALAQRRAERARRPGVGLEGQRPADGRCPLGARPARARAGARQDGAADARHAHPVARAEADRADAQGLAREGGHGRRARHAHRRHPRDGGGARRAARGLPRRQRRPSGGCAPSPTSTSPARRSSS